MPSFYLLGVPKCGTSAVHDSLNQHPFVAKAIPKARAESRQQQMWTDQDMTCPGHQMRRSNAPHLSYTSSFLFHHQETHFWRSMANSGLLNVSIAREQRQALTRRFGQMYEKAVLDLEAAKQTEAAQGGALLAGAGWERIALGEFSPENFLRWSAFFSVPFARLLSRRHAAALRPVCCPAPSQRFACLEGA